MNKIMLIIVFNILVCSTYNVGDIMGMNHQNQEFELCYGAPNNTDGNIRFSDFNGNLNGGEYSIIVIDMSATWCGPCQSLIPLFDDLQQQYINNDYVKFFVALSDLNQPYSCNQWGNLGDSGIPNIIDDTGYPIFNMFNTGGSFPSLVMIDHEMKVHHKEAGFYNTFVQDASEIIDEMLYNLENSLILYPSVTQAIDESFSDNDNLLNPGENFTLNFSIENNSFYLDALNISAVILDNDNNDINFNIQNFNWGDVNVDNASSFSVNASVSEDVMIGSHEFILMINAGYLDLNNNYNEKNIEFTFNIDISLSQEGFPFDTNSEIKPSSVIIDLDNDGNNEIIFGDNNGMIRALNHNGIEIFNDFFPFDTGNQIWGSAASGYIDQDNLIDVAILSKSKHLYVFDNNGLKLDYNSNKFLIGTPALGNLDNDDDLEIVFGSFSSSAQLFAVNIDGSDVEGFPVDLGEKSQKGVALADFNNNGKDDIVIGTDSDNIFLVYDNGQVASGFPFLAQDKIRSAPVVLDLDDEKIIIAGSKDNNLYAINSDGSLRFLFQADDEIYTSPSFLNTEQGLHIFFGTDSGYLYSLDINGNLNDGFPINNIDNNYFDSIVGSIVFEDLDSDGFEELIFGDELGKMYVLKTLDETYSDLYRYNSFPISNIFAYTSSPNVFDIDNDGDYEIYAGTSGDVVIIDIKEFYSVVSQENWNTYRGGFDRRGYYNYILPCVSGDLNNDDIINILDIVTVVNIVIDNLDISDAQQCSGDVNNDSIINILDIVTLVNWIIN